MRPLTRTTTVALAGLLIAASASAADHITGQVLGGGAPIAGSTVTLWAARADAPKQLAQAKSDADGRFELKAGTARPIDATFAETSRRRFPSSRSRVRIPSAALQKASFNIR